MTRDNLIDLIETATDKRAGLDRKCPTKNRPKCNWRDIPANSIAWRDNEISSIAGGKVHRMCSAGSIWQDSQFSSHAWQDKTLGEIADMGPRHWRRCSDIGDMAVAVIKWMIDEAAEGRPRMLASSGEPASDAYVPKCERTDW